MATTRTRRGLRRPGARSRTVDRVRADLKADVLEAYAGVRAGTTVEPTFVLDAFALREVRGGPDMLVAQPSGVDARGRLEHHPLPDGESIAPSLRVDDLAILLCGSEGHPPGVRLEAEGFLYASHVPWPSHHGIRVPGASRRWRVDRVQRRDIVWSDIENPRVVRTPLDAVPRLADLDDGTVVELVLRRP